MIGGKLGLIYYIGNVKDFFYLFCGIEIIIRFKYRFIVYFLNYFLCKRISLDIFIKYILYINNLFVTVIFICIVICFNMRSMKR